MKYSLSIIILFAALTLVPHDARAAQLFFRTDKTSYKVGQTGFVTLNVNTEKKALNAVSAIITFDPSLVEITKVSLDRVIVNFWVQSTAINNSKGTVTIKGIILNPAYNGTLGRIIGLDFKAIGPGKVQFGIVGFSVLANDGKGTALTTKGVGHSITVAGTAVNRSGISIASSSHANQQKWYNKANISVSWKALEKDILAFVYGFNKNSKAEMPTAGTTKATSTVQRSVTSGVWYAHVRAQHKTKGWLPTQHFKINIDLERPSTNTVTVLPRLSEAILPTIRASAKDELSGIATYEVIVNGKLLTSAKTVNGLKLSKLKIGKNTVDVKAIDNAGNARTSSVTVLYNPLPGTKATPTTPKTTPIPTPTTPKIKAPIQFD